MVTEASGSAMIPDHEGLPIFQTLYFGSAQPGECHMESVEEVPVERRAGSPVAPE
jgi:hypothetical protein